MGLWVIVMGGHTAEVGWFRSKTDIFHNDVVLIDRSQQVAFFTTLRFLCIEAPPTCSIFPLCMLCYPSAGDRQTASWCIQWAGAIALLCSACTCPLSPLLKKLILIYITPADCHSLSPGQVRWRTPEVVGELPPPRELHSLTPLSDGRLLLFGGQAPAPCTPHICPQLSTAQYCLLKLKLQATQGVLPDASDGLRWGAAAAAV